MVKSHKGIEHTVKYYIENPPDKLTPKRALQRIAGYIYADGGTRSTIYFINSNINYLEDFVNSLRAAYGKQVDQSLVCYGLAKSMNREEIVTVRESLIDDASYYTQRLGLPMKLRAYADFFKQRSLLLMITIKKPYSRKLRKHLRIAKGELELDFLAAYINGDGYINKRSDGKGYAAYIKEADPQKLTELHKVIEKCFAVRTYNVPMKNMVRVQIPLSFHSAAALAVYGCNKVLKTIPWYAQGRYFKFLTRIKDPEHITIKDGVVPSNAKLRQLMRAGYLERVYKSRGNKPSVYRLTPKAMILYNALRLANQVSMPNALRVVIIQARIVNLNVQYICILNKDKKAS